MSWKELSLFCQYFVRSNKFNTGFKPKYTVGHFTRLKSHLISKKQTAKIKKGKEISFFKKKQISKIFGSKKN